MMTMMLFYATMRWWNQGYQ